MFVDIQTTHGRVLRGQFEFCFIRDNSKSYKLSKFNAQTFQTYFYAGKETHPRSSNASCNQTKLSHSMILDGILKKEDGEI